MINDVNNIAKPKTPNQIVRFVFDSLIEINPKSFLFWNEESDKKMIMNPIIIKLMKLTIKFENYWAGLKG